MKRKVREAIKGQDPQAACVKFGALGDGGALGLSVSGEDVGGGGESGPCGGLEVSQAIAHQNRARQVEAQNPRRVVQHARIRLAPRMVRVAITLALWVERTGQHQITPRRSQEIRQPRLNSSEVRPIKITPGQTRLIGDHHNRNPPRIEGRNRRRRPRFQF